MNCAECTVMVNKSSELMLFITSLYSVLNELVRVVVSVNTCLCQYPPSLHPLQSRF